MVPEKRYRRKRRLMVAVYNHEACRGQVKTPSSYAADLLETGNSTQEKTQKRHWWET